MDAGLVQLMRSLTNSVEELTLSRVDAADKGAHLKYAELTGRIETMRTVIAFCQQTAQAEAAVAPQTGETPPETEKAKKTKEAK